MRSRALTKNDELDISVSSALVNFDACEVGTHVDQLKARRDQCVSSQQHMVDMLTHTPAVQQIWLHILTAYDAVRALYTACGSRSQACVSEAGASFLQHATSIYKSMIGARGDLAKADLGAAAASGVIPPSFRPS